MSQPANTVTHHQPAKRTSRRGFHRTAAAAASSAFAFYFIPSSARGALERPALAGIGTGGKGASDIKGAQQAGFQIAALVDVVDQRKAAGVKLARGQGRVQAELSSVPFFDDYREMLDQMGDRIDAVTVSTPDHHHFHASWLAMKAGKHVYCQKPLTNDIWEARELTRVAAETGVKTQMGNQAHAKDHMRRCIELLQAGVIGKVREVHAWTNRPIWPQGIADPPPPEPVPKWMNWEQWIGPAQFVDYSSKIAPFNWRGIWDYGCGALGDMACHIMDMGYWALQPGAPMSMKAEAQGGTAWSPPISSQITWKFGPSEYTPKEGCRFTWYDGYPHARFDRETWSLVKEGDDFNHPPDDIMMGEDHRKYGSVLIGERGRLCFHRDKLNWKLDVDHEIDGFDWPEQSLPRATGEDNYVEWFEAVTGKLDRSQSDFAHAGPFTEMILLGTLAQRRPGETLEWDSDALTINGLPEPRAWMTEYPQGWKVGG